MAVRFNGTSDGLGVTAPVGILNNVSRATIMAWCRPLTVSGTPTVFAASVGPPPGLSGSSRFSIDRSAGGNIGITVRSTDAGAGVGFGTGGFDYTSNAWQHIAFVMYWSTQNGIMYKNGEVFGNNPLLPSGPFPAGNTSATDPKAIAIGANEDFAAGFWNGDIEDCRIYNRILSQEEIQAIVAAKGKDGIVSGLQVRYPLVDGAIGDNVILSHCVINNQDASPIAAVGPVRPLAGAPKYIDGIITGPRSRNSISTGFII